MGDDMSGDGSPPLILYETAPEKRQAIVRLGPRAHFRDMVAHFREQIRSQPDLASYDFVCDLSNFAGDAFVGDVKAIADDYAPHAVSELTYTCFATRDPNFALWARSMDDMFPRRKHLVFTSVEDCLAFLEQERRGT